jgi:hypothetical protein
MTAPLLNPDLPEQYQPPVQRIVWDSIRLSRGRAPLGIAAFLAIPLFFSSLMASTLAQEKPNKIQWHGCHSGVCTVWHPASTSNEARIWLFALVPSVVLVLIGLIAARLPLGFYVSCLASIVIAMAVVHKTGTWAAHHTARFPYGVDLIPSFEPQSNQYSAGQWEKDALNTALSLQHWTIGIALAAMLVMAALWARSKRKRPEYPADPSAAIEATGGAPQITGGG